ncbi:hypothetical protein NADFUDRAFT_27013 [Nadsonia fulvescens var. elongata DSM 6958]|uniref:UNC-45/Cro1/She4 central domain-containing protein n=1 Tax=Nadsonia fulvescens var. elongata DSM 6958 TaxID=857566 RepID=A0A1E3PGS3_9ASCO|nr:hypothetical protein NADFUDRAFT_27013 [Nadsonia fulvescens var. elongata DSM 6958]
MLNIIVSNVLPYVDLRHKPEIKSKSAIVLAKCLELNLKATQSQLTEEIETLLVQNDLTALILVFSVVSTLFHINSDIGADLFHLPSFQATTQQQNFKGQYLLSSQFVAAALECLSSACIDKECRITVLKNYSNLVEEAVNNGQERVRLLAGIVLVKVQSVSNPITHGATTTKKEAGIKPTQSIDSLSLIFEQTFSNELSDAECISVASEGLAYSTLEVSVRKRLITNQRALKRLTNIIQTQLKNPSLVYGALSIISNLTFYPPQLSKEQKKMWDLKTYADKQGQKEIIEDTKLIDARNRVILDSKVVKIISDNCPRYSLASKAVCANILNSLSNVKSHRGIIAQDGGVATLIYLSLPSDDKNNTTGLDAQASCSCGSALAKTLISVNPALVFTAKLSPVVAVRPLINQIQNEASQVPLLDTFEALLALTNIASFNDSCRDTMIKTSWDKLENLFTASNHTVQRASLELLCNLMMSPFCAEKYLDGSLHAKSRLELLAALTDIDDQVTQRAVVGALAMMSEWGPAGEIIGQNEKLVNCLFQMILDDVSEEVLHRVIVTVNNMAHTSTPGKAKVIAFLRNHGAISVIQSLMKNTKNSSILEIALDTVQVFAK